jgi:hypothetical protein
MRNCGIGLIAFIAGLVMFSSVSGAQNAGKGKAAKANAEPSPPADPHDLSGVWRRRGGNLTMSNDVPPMTPEGQAKFNATKPGYGPRSVPPAVGNDPMGTCDPLGLTRLIFFEVAGRPMEMIQIPGRVIQFFEWGHVWREIWTDGRELPKDPEPRWLGYSVGKWDGDTFVVDTIGFDDKTWLDHFGNPHSDQMRFQERYRRLNRDTMELSMTLTDPKIYTKPWVSETKTLQWQPKTEIDEVFCVPSEEQAFNKRMRDPAGGLTNKK